MTKQKRLSDVSLACKQLQRDSFRSDLTQLLHGRVHPLCALFCCFLYSISLDWEKPGWWQNFTAQPPPVRPICRPDGTWQETGPVGRHWRTHKP